jgi:hypothetical protein
MLKLVKVFSAKEENNGKNDTIRTALKTQMDTNALRELDLLHWGISVHYS